jgi:DNA processing protein
VTACDGCLRRTALLGLLAPWIERARKPNRRRLPEVLALSDGELIEALCGTKRAEVDGPLARFDPARARVRAQAARIEVVCRHAPGYPRVLAHAADAPAALHLIGDGALLERATRDGAVAIVGSRRASSYGMEMARSLGRDLAACDVPVVSGMAYGADSAAHEGALAAGGPTIAVMPGGADHAYPGGKRRLYEQVKTSGLAVSEMPPGMRPFRWSFPARNRIMAALARMTVVVEGTEGSGSLITAGFAQDLGRDVGAVPGQATSPLAAGPNRLLSEGAVVVRSATDVLDALFGPGHRPGPATTSGAGAPHPALAERLEPRLRRLLKFVETGTGSVEGLAEGTDVADALAGLSELEFLGFVGRGPGGDYVRRV